MSEMRKRQCREIAEKALHAAATSDNPDTKRTYVQLAALCHELADHIDRHAAANPIADGATKQNPPDTKR
jgi:hypothetical protein